MSVALQRQPPRLVKYEAARSALAEARRVDEVKHIRDATMAAALYARQAKDTEMERMASEIRLRAERRAGEMLRESARVGARQPRAHPKAESKRNDSAPRLRDLGISKDQSHQWQKLAAIPEAEFEKRLAQATEPVTTVGMLGAGSCGPLTRRDMASHIGVFIGSLEDAMSLYGSVEQYDAPMLVKASSPKSIRALLPRVKALRTWLEKLQHHLEDAL